MEKIYIYKTTNKINGKSFLNHIRVSIGNLLMENEFGSKK